MAPRQRPQSRGRGTRRTRIRLHARGLKEPIAPFSHAARYGPLVFVGAKGSIKPGTGTPAHLGDTRSQARLVMENALAALRQLDADANDVIQVRAWLTEWNRADEVEAIIRTYVPSAHVTHISHSPRFPIPGFLVEMDLIAIDASLRKESLHAGGIIAGGLALSETIRGGPYGDVPQTAREQITRAMQRLHDWLSASSLSESDLAQVVVDLSPTVEMADFAAAWREVLTEPRPPWVLVRSHLRRRHSLVDLQAIASSRHDVRRYELQGGLPSVSGESAVAATGDLLFTAGTDVPLLLGAPWSLSPTATLQSYLAAAHADAADLLRVNVTLPSWKLYAPLNAEYADFVVPPYPARTTTQVALTMTSSRSQLDAVCAMGDGAITVLTGAGAAEFAVGEITDGQH